MSQFTVFGLDVGRRIYRYGRKCFANACIIERARLGGGSVMVLAGISHGVKSPLVVVAGNLTAIRYRDDILRLVVVPLVHQCSLIF